jgi:hypothetical protein
MFGHPSHNENNILLSEVPQSDSNMLSSGSEPAESIRNPMSTGQTALLSVPGYNREQPSAISSNQDSVACVPTRSHGQVMDRDS